ncbi:FAD/NAD(P)-binding domain-containing protein [Coniophora puteana RWD-64-598 SS2]|uniref:FAD/NAD(P)-binding domain-containing protein n=1 Tax=Coniophora puteana (strain RWD-64-598) TaxID=741705 RepID=R7SEF6_CONPW|nr:FAD/NAD(P)-binding domain-containing protein [Coniophora puteana RWD-64-598 SS2]EIW74563.1 FAD/NAD(P)-binding domain-containing protein [Coniophora puteana RWD-64-598 SS2]
MASPKFRVAIAGGGVGGLMLAVALSAYPDIGVYVYESARTFSEIGAGVVMKLRPFQVVKRISEKLASELISKTPCEYTEEYVPSWKFRRSDGDEGEYIFHLKTRGHVLLLHRADFHGVLLDNLGANVKTYTSKRLATYEQPNDRTSPISLTFADGTTETCDLLVGADGIKSVVRTKLMKELAQEQAENPAEGSPSPELYLSCVEPAYSGMNSHRSLVPADKLAAVASGHRSLTEPLLWLAKSRVITSYPVSKGKYINISANELHPDIMRKAHNPDPSVKQEDYEAEWMRPVPGAEWSAPFKHMEKDLLTLLDLVESGNIWGVHVVKNLPTFVHGRVAVMGDAAHAMTPFQGSGAGQAVEDAYILATVLGHQRTTIATLPTALAVYDQIRRPFAQGIAAASMMNGLISGMEVGEPLSQMEESISKQWSWGWTTSLDPDVEKAVKLLEERLGA